VRTFQIITIAVPVSNEDELSFDDLLDELANQAKEPIAKATLYDWIKNVCKLRSSGIYADSYFMNDLECLIQWLAFRRQFKRGKAVSQFQEYLKNLIQEQNHETEPRTN